MITTDETFGYVLWEEDPWVKRVDVTLDMPVEWIRKDGSHLLRGSMLTSLDNVHLYGSASVGMEHGAPILDTAYYGRFDLWERNKPYFNEAVDCMGKPAHILDEAISLNTVWSNNYFHWVLDLLPRLAILMEYTRSKRWWVIVPPNPAPFIRDSLEFLGIKNIQEASPHILVRKLWLAKADRQEGIVDPRNVSRLRDMYSLWRGSTVDECLVYVSRELQKKRRVHNRSRVVHELASSFNRPVHIVKAEEHSFKQQVQMFSECGQIVGPHGAGLVNMVWMPEGSRVTEIITPTYTNPCHWLLGLSCGHDYSFIHTRAVKDNEDMVVDPEDIRKLGGLYAEQ